MKKGKKNNLKKEEDKVKENDFNSKKDKNKDKSILKKEEDKAKSNNDNSGGKDEDKIIEEVNSQENDNDSENNEDDSDKDEDDVTKTVKIKIWGIKNKIPSYIFNSFKKTLKDPDKFTEKELDEQYDKFMKKKIS